MPEEFDDLLQAELNAQTNSPLHLYRIQIDSDPNNDLFLTDWMTSLSHLGQTYTAFPIVRSNISQNSEGRLDALQLSVSNANRAIQYFVEQNNALRGKRVTIRRTTLTQINNPTGYLEAVYYVDSVSCNDRVVTFNLSNRLDVLQVRLPKRLYLRDLCPWTFKGMGCWRQSGSSFVQPTGWSDTGSLYSPEVSAGYWGTSAHAPINNGTFTYNGKAVYQLEPEGTSRQDTLTKLLVGTAVEGTDVTLTLYDARDEITFQHGTGEDCLNLTGNSDYTIDSKNKYLKLRRVGNQWVELTRGNVSARSSAYAIFKPTRIYGVDMATGWCKLQIKCDAPAAITSATLILSSSGSSSSEALSLALNPATISPAYQIFTYNLADFNQIGGGLNFSNGINYCELAMNFNATWQAGWPAIVNWYWKTLQLGPVASTGCDKRLDTCRLHNNQARYGGFPNVPEWRNTRV